ncbi:hypothetical protein CR513_51282, partial [Mucuna pruriens]
MDRSMIDVASGGALMNKTPAATRHLISSMASSQPRMVNEIGEVDKLRLENQLNKLTSLVRKLAIGQHQPSIVARVCGICTSVEHPTDMCPTLQETESNPPRECWSNMWLSIQKAVFDNQYGKQPLLGPSQGPYVAQRFGHASNAPQGQADYQ